MDFAIRQVFDEETGERYDAAELFKTAAQGHEFRTNYLRTDQKLRCCFCEDKATVGTTGKGHVYFKHFPNTIDCFLKNSSLTQHEREEIENYLASREGKRHKSLKRSLAKYLMSTQGVNPDTISIDDRYLNDSTEKRRPDVYCEFNGRKMAFEIQISRLPGRYIFKRHEFYKRNDIFLVWILDDFDVKGQNQTEKDIKYLNEHQNFFYFFDSQKNPSLVVQFKEGLVNSRGEDYYPWTHEFVSLHDLQFDSEEFQVYYRSLRSERLKAYDLQEERRNKELIKPAIELFRNFYQNDDERIIPKIEATIDELDLHAFELLNRKIGGVDDSNIFFTAIANGKPHFLRYILDNHRFVKNLNTKNKDGKNLLEVLMRQSKLVWPPETQLIFANDYVISDSDLQFIATSKGELESKSLREMKIIKLLAYNHLRKMKLLKLYDEFDGAILTILSAKQKKIVGLALPNFLSLANNAIHSYKKVWHFIEQAFKFYGIWDEILASDRKKTFAGKHADYLKNREIEKADQAYDVLAQLFPEVFRPSLNQKEWFKPEMIELESTK